MAIKYIPSLTTRGSTDLPVLMPFSRNGAPYDEMFLVRWLASIPLKYVAVIFLFWPILAFAKSGGYGVIEAFEALGRWISFITFKGFLFNVLISILSMTIGTLAGAALGLGQVSQVTFIRRTSYLVTQLFRNSPWLVILFVVLLTFPFEVTLFGYDIQIPPWVKAVFGLSLPVMANISEIVRGAVNSVQTGQWEAAESMSFTRTQTLWQIILPQCFKQMIPPWMNWYAILTMATPLCSLLGVGEIITYSRQAMEAEDNFTALLIPFYGYALLLFFVYCYPIARLTIRLEKKFSVIK